MFGDKRKGKYSKTGLELDASYTEQDDEVEVGEVLTLEEQNTVAKVLSDYEYSKAVRESECDETGYSIEDTWEDEYYIYKGGGLQWLTNIAYRSKRARQIRPNSEANYVFNTLTIQHANITSDTPEIQISDVGVEDGKEDVGDDLTNASKHNDIKNKFPQVFKKWVYDFIGAGPIVAQVIWDQDWIGGRGPNKWVGDVRVKRIDKTEMFFDPAIINLEEDMQKCSYIDRRVFIKLETIRERWEKGRLVGQETNDDWMVNEGGNPQQAYIHEYWHRGFPWFIPDERKEALLEQATKYEEDGKIYKAEDYRDSAKGDLLGIHVAYVSDSGVLLEYRPYEYEHGQYPFVFATRYYDEKNPWGFGEIRNIKIPQIMCNKADEIELEAMAQEGLGGAYFQEGAISETQLDNILENSGKGGMWFPVDGLNQIKERTGLKVPASLGNYKEHKKGVIETVASNSEIQQGIAQPGVPYASVKELGARSDVRMGSISNKLEDFLMEVNKLRIELFAQFYTEERYWRIKGADGNMQEGKIKADKINRDYTRETIIKQSIDPETGLEVGIPIPQIESFVPEFDISVTVVSEKPTDRGYYTQLGRELYQMQLLTPEHFLSTLDEGKLPPNDEILKALYVMQPMMGITAQMQELPEELQQMIMQQIQQVVQSAMQQTEMIQQSQKQTN